MEDLVAELTRSGGPSAKWNNVGDTHKLRIESVDKRQVTDFVTGEPQTWPNGEPKFQFVFSGIDESGDETRFFVKGYQLNAVKDALRTAGVKAGDTLIGGHLTIKLVGIDEPTRPGLSGAKQWKAKFEPPAPVGSLVDDIL